FVSGHRTCRGLSDLGRQQAQALHDRLATTGEIEADVLLTSELPRAIETAQIIAPAIGADLVAEQDCDLCEIHVGDEAEGLTWEQFGERWPSSTWDPNVSTTEGGESWYGFGERVLRTIEKHTSTHADKTIVAAVHGGIIEQAIYRLLGLDAARNQIGHVVNTSITELWLRENPFRPQGPRWELTRYNDHAHTAGLPASST
ncbi:MAG TPA: histidine phosphatase family protein, partial [Acidimicrobiales bacterium]|nr:histidine phosphatase family protein [Acidimicrobiales bacterium]